MEAIAHSPEFAKKAGVPQSVGKDYAAADKGKKFAVGGPSLAKVGKQNTRHGKMDMPFSQLNRFAGMKTGGFMKEPKAMVGKEVAFMKKKGAPKSMIKHEAAEMGAMKKGGMPMKDGKPAFMKGMAKGGGIESKGKTKGMMVKMATGGVVKFAKGGGIESKGKTKGTMIKMQGC